MSQMLPEGGENNIDEESLELLGDDELKELVPKIGPRLKLKKYIQSLKEFPQAPDEVNPSRSPIRRLGSSTSDSLTIISDEDIFIATQTSRSTPNSETEILADIPSIAKTTAADDSNSLQNDFNHMYPGKENKLFSTLDLKRKDIIAYAKRKAEHSRNSTFKTEIVNLTGKICEVMRRVACADVCPAPLAPPAPLHPANRTSENKELLRQQLLSASKARADKGELPKPKHRSRQKNRWKLKFHHQALPQEYLDHYEQSLQKANKTKKPEKPKPEPVDLNNSTNETFKIWAQRLAGIQNETGSLTVTNIHNMAKAPKKDERKKSPAIAPSKIVTYEDLPYMGEMTLNNSKPRRGRKPKKADICHLIYENYGTVVPGQPPPQVERNQLSLCPPIRSDALSTPKTDIQNKIISNLLERKLSQENKKRMETLTPPQFASPDEPMPEAPVTIAGPLHSDEEPLNLCIRDLHELKIQIQKKFGNIYTSLPEIKTEPEIIEDKEQPNAISVIQRNTNLPVTASSSPDLSRQNRNVSPTLSEPAQSTAGPDGEGKFPGYVYWPNAGIYMHPLALQTQLLYYQRLAASGQLPFSPEEQERLSTPSSVSESVSTEPTPPVEDNKNKLVLKQISELLDPNVIKKTEESKIPDLGKMKRVSPNPVPVQAPVKRKRSAIFIPPVPTKTNSTTPTTEVSICKFKFTGGSKPSLQEKKMLSVDSGGNFRYYSGTGNKGNKGYDYLHRDSNQGRAQLAEASASSQPKIEAPAPTLSKEDLSKKKRKSRKSLQREKLEQTFKEKGFLIQTQQLQSAEGATYCKFRQLRKFTRYLFRSWKDYLPGELDERTGEAVNPQPSPSEGPASEWG